MDFAFTEEQSMLADSLAKFLAHEYGFEQRGAIRASGEGFSREVWRGFAEMGLLGLPFAEEHGGFGGTPVDTLLVMQALGKALVLEPYWSTVVMAGNAIHLGGSAAQKNALLPAIAGGERIFAWAHGEPGSRYDLAHVETVARAEGDAHVLDGGKSVVLFGAQADSLIVSARSEGGVRDAAGISLFIIHRGQPGVSVRDYRTIDGLRAAEITFKSVRAGAQALLGDRGAGHALIEQVSDLGLAALCAEGVGLMEALNAATLDYLKTRQQFGQPIGRFQALQHRMADMLLHQEQARSMSYLAALHCTDKDQASRQRTLSAAKVTVGQACRFIAQNAVQLHGGMGMTDELMLSHWFKRLTAIEMSFGDTDFHLQRFATHLSQASRAA